ncbi:MAG: C40 family peptidase [Actinomycetes bacterium]|nr:C40 family peptidase [Actinomycetes bacterium]
MCVLQPTLSFAAKKTVTNDKIKAAQAQADAAQEKLDKLATQTEMASEDYYAAKAQTEATTKKIKQTERELDAARQSLAEAKSQLATRSADMYRDGELSFLQLLTGVDSLKDLISRIELLQRVAQNDADLIVAVREAKAQIELTKADLEAQRATQKKHEAAELKELKRVQGLVSEQKSYLASLSAKIKKLMAEERARQEAEERRKAEEARKAAEAARKAAEEARKKDESTGSGSGSAGSDSGSSSNSGGNDSGGSGGSSSVGNLGSNHPEVVKEARKYIGVTPYVWGGTTPAGFDCSGLTQYCYRVAAGMSIPRTSRSQFTVGTFIPADRKDLLKPGDLVFFGYDADPTRIHHVGIYSGGGMMIHAPQTGQKVKESYAFRSDYVGAVRP